MPPPPAPGRDPAPQVHVAIKGVMDLVKLTPEAAHPLAMNDVTMDAGRSVVVRCGKGGGNGDGSSGSGGREGASSTSNGGVLKVFSLEDPEKVRLTLPMTAEAALMAPTAPLLAVRKTAGGDGSASSASAPTPATTGSAPQAAPTAAPPSTSTVLQIYDLLSRDKIADITHPEAVSFWTWASDDRMVLVTSTAVYNLTLRPTPALAKAYPLRPEMRAPNVFVWQYCEDAEGGFRFLMGLKKGGGGAASGRAVDGVIQYEPVGAPHDARMLDGFMVGCAEDTASGSKIIAYAKANKVSLVTLETGANRANTLRPVEAPLAFDQDGTGADFPVAVLFHPPRGTARALSVVSKEGRVHVFDVPSLTPITQFCVFESRGKEGRVTRAVNARGDTGGGGDNPSPIAFYVLSTLGVVKRVAVHANAASAAAAEASRRETREWQHQQWATFTGMNGGGVAAAAAAAPPPQPQAPPLPRPSQPRPPPSRRYEVVRPLGRGGQGAVVLAKLKLARGGVNVGGNAILTALKRIPCTSLGEANYALEEVKALSANKAHDGVVSIFDFFLEEAERGEHTQQQQHHLGRRVLFYVCIACEYCPCGDLASHLSGHPAPPPPQQLVRWAGDMASTLTFIHASGFVHRDLKPANIFLTESGALRLGDFGLARGADANAVTCCGTPMFIAPEVLAQEPTTCAVDMWSLGCVLYYIVTRKERALNYQIQSNVNLRTEIRHDLTACGIPPFLADLIVSLVQLSPAARPTAQQMWDRLRGEPPPVR